MTHWDMLNKATKFEFSLFYMSHCVICSPVWSFLYHVIALLQMAHLILPTLRENGTNIVKASRFLLAATIGRLFDSHFSLVDFSLNIPSVVSKVIIILIVQSYNTRLAAWIKMILGRARNILMPSSINSIAFFKDFPQVIARYVAQIFLSHKNFLCNILILAYFQCLRHQTRFCFWHFRKSTPFAVVPINPFVPGKLLFLVQCGLK